MEEARQSGSNAASDVHETEASAGLENWPERASALDLNQQEQDGDEQEGLTRRHSEPEAPAMHDGCGPLSRRRSAGTIQASMLAALQG
jgi:hypothetical protein